MYEFINGPLCIKKPNYVVIDVNGIGFKVHIPINLYPKLPDIQSRVFVYTYLVIREDAHTVYGFLEQKERELFENLITVSGIGPRTALAILGHAEYETLQLAIEQGNVSLLSKVPGIGKKTAERVVVELKDKARLWEKGVNSPFSKNALAADAIQALMNLGYNNANAQKAIQAVLSQEQELEDLGKIITAALKKL